MLNKKTLNIQLNSYLDWFTKRRIAAKTPYFEAENSVINLRQGTGFGPDSSVQLLRPSR